MATLRTAVSWLASKLWEISEGETKPVTPREALKYPPVWYAVNKIGGHIGQLPLVLHKRTNGGRGAERAVGHPAYKLLKTRPNEWQTPIVFKELLASHALLWGNAYAYIHRAGTNPVQLIPLHPGRTSAGFVKGYKVFAHKAEADEPILRFKTPGSDDLIAFPDEDVLHVQGLGFDGISGEAFWKIASESLGIGLASDRRIRSGFEKGFKAAMLLEAPEGAFRKPGEAEEFITDFNNRHSGSENADRAGLLTRGIKANVVAMNSQESQMVEHRRYQRQDAALLFLLEQILGDDSSVSYNSLEQKNLAYLSNCLMRWLVRWEEELNRKLLTERQIDADSHYFKFNVAALLRADHKTTLDALSIGINARIYNPNEAREKLDMNPYDGGDEYANPAITPGTAADEAEEPESDDAPTPNNRALRSRVSQLVRIEIQRVTDHTNAANFCEWLDGFYAKWEGKLGDAMEELGGDRLLAERHCKESKRQLLHCADQAHTAEELAAVVGECVANWEARVDGIATLMEQAVG